MDKYEYIVNLAEKTAKRVSQNRESWMKFLTSAARIYKYPFKEQLLIYAQNPDATACASIEIWNKRMNCWVNKGSSGIALPDDIATYGHKMEIPESLKRLPPHIRGFESSIGSGFRSANGLYLTQHQKRYMIPYWRLKNSERTVTSGTGNIREYSKEADRNLRDLQTVQDNKIRTVQDLSSRLDELNQMTDSIRRELRAIQSSREDSETENVISEYLSIQSAFANAAVPIEMEGKFENRLDEIEENYPIEELIHQKESNSKKEKQLQKEIKNLQQASRRLSKLKKIQKR